MVDRIELTLMSHSFPEDLSEFFVVIGLERRIPLFRKNCVFAFADGVAVAEIIHAVLPKIIQRSAFADVSKADGRLAQWQQVRRTN